MQGKCKIIWFCNKCLFRESEFIVAAGKGRVAMQPDRL
jgi:hypothetical protein